MVAHSLREREKRDWRSFILDYILEVASGTSIYLIVPFLTLASEQYKQRQEIRPSYHILSIALHNQGH